MRDGSNNAASTTSILRYIIAIFAKYTVLAEMGSDKKNSVSREKYSQDNIIGMPKNSITITASVKNTVIISAIQPISLTAGASEMTDVISANIRKT